MRPIDAEPLVAAIDKALDDCRDMRDLFVKGDYEWVKWDTKVIMLQNFKDTVNGMPTLK